MGFYIKNQDKQSGDGLSITEWNDLSNAVAGNAGLKLALSSEDNIGIGTTVPKAKLHVDGDLRIGKFSDLDADTGRITSAITTESESFPGLNIIGIGDGGAETRKVHLHAQGGLEILGNVGIGTDTPAEKLEVVGNVKAAKFIGDGSQLTNLNVGVSGLNLATDENARVGIGTNDPKARLHVSGDLLVGNGNEADPRAGTIRAGNGQFAGLNITGIGENTASRKIHLHAQGGLQVVGKMGIGTANPTADLEVAGDIKAERYIGVGLVWGPVQKTGLLNSFDKALDYTVPDGHVMVGISSHHSNKHEDRRWSVKYRKLTMVGG